MKEALVTTDLGLLTSDNANWLFKNNIISRDGSIRFSLRDGMTEKKAQLYSYFRWIIQDIKEKIPSAPRQIAIGMNELIELMKNGVVSKEYNVGKEQYHYIAKYNIVDNIYNVGRRICLDHQGNGGKKTKSEFIDFED